MRWVIVLSFWLSGCVSFHPLDKQWDREAKPSVTAVDADAPVRRPRPTPWQTIGSSVQGRPLRIRRIGHGPRRVLWIGGIHGNEREGALTTDRLPAAFAREPGAAEQVTLTILEDANPDGTAANTRGNANGVDLNRNYPAANFVPGPRFGRFPLDQPEAKALYDLVLAERPHLVIVAHSWRDDHFINFDGPALDLAERFSRHSGYRVHASDRFAPTPGSLGSWVGRKLQIPILTLEHQRGSDPLRCWLATRRAILSVILKA
ncbi:MAG TPA: hypothetical protein ENI87_06615 [bacterium]|nr:hypothetical protein [bacterium]